ncbi:MAG: Rrf2 family transcriptional regulator [Planctomycetaceae bacterium]|nr:Rrf2 family transcriptional regulator [Planctomycetaceae bacterium]|tara:strand:+ start:3152 stop:3580 length:429 start_codon:yes stop_codon:yes gene_type:complete
MNISAKTEYACVAILELAGRYGNNLPVRIKDISERHGIPNRFLVQILLQLKGAGLVISIRGASGGYRLAQDPKNISLGQVMSIVDGNASQLQQNSENSTPYSGVLLSTWTRIRSQQQRRLQEITFADLLEQAAGQSEAMYYI